MWPVKRESPVNLCFEIEHINYTGWSMSWVVVIAINSHMFNMHVHI